MSIDVYRILQQVGPVTDRALKEQGHVVDGSVKIRATTQRLYLSFEIKPQTPVEKNKEEHKMLTEKLYDSEWNLLRQRPYLLSRLFAPGQERVENGVSMTILSCKKKGDIVETRVKLHAPWPCPNCKETVKECACMRNLCRACKKPVGNITFTYCDACFEAGKNLPTLKSGDKT